MKIAVIGTRGFPRIQGGVEKHCEALYSSIAAKGHRVCVFRRKPYVHEGDGVCAVENIVFHDLWTFRNQYLEAIVHSCLAALICLFRRPHLVHIHNIGPALVLPFLKIAGIKTVVTYHSANYLHSKWNGFARKVLKLGERWVMSLADAVICVSRRQCESLPPGRGVYIPNGVNTPGCSSDIDYVRRIGAKPGEYILAVARFTPEKGLHDLVEAYGQMDTPYNLVITGNADHESSYSKKLLQTISKDPRIILTGYIDGVRLQQVYTHARIFVLPSYHEGLPLVLLEALSYGLPVLASDIQPNKDMVMPMIEYYRCGDVKELRNGIIALLTEPPNKDAVKVMVRTIKERFDWDRIAEETIAVYHRVYGKC